MLDDAQVVGGRLQTGPVALNQGRRHGIPARRHDRPVASTEPEFTFRCHERLMLSVVLSNGPRGPRNTRSQIQERGGMWWRRGRVELPVQSTRDTNVYGCSHHGLISPTPTRWRLRAESASLSWSFVRRP